jgi:WD40 repeat protein
MSANESNGMPKICLLLALPRQTFVRAEWLSTKKQTILAVTSSGQVSLISEGSLKQVAEIAPLQPGFCSIAWITRNNTLAVITQSGLFALRLNGNKFVTSRLNLKADRSILAICHKPLSETMALATDDGQIWSIDTAGHDQTLLYKFGRNVTSIAWRPGEEHITCGHSSGELSIVRATSGLLQTPDVFGNALNSCPVTAIAWSGPKTVYFCRFDGSVYRVDAEFVSDKGIKSQKPKERLSATPLGRLPAPLISMAPSPERQILAAGSCHGRLYMISTVTGYAEVHKSGHSGWLNSVSWNATQRSLLTCGDDGIVRVWDVESASSNATIPTMHDNRILVANHGGDLVALVSSSATQVLHLGILTRPLSADFMITAIAVRPNTDELTLGTAGGDILLSPKFTDDRTLLFSTGSTPIALLSWDPTGGHLLAVSELGIGFVHHYSYTDLYTLRCDSGAITAACWIRDHGHLALGLDNGSVLLFTVGTPPTQTVHFVGHQHAITEILEIPSGIVTRDVAGELRLWSVSSRSCVATIGHEQSLRSFTIYLKNDDALVTLAANGSGAVLSASTMQILRKFEAPIGEAKIVFAIDGQRPVMFTEPANYQLTNIDA